MVPQGRYGFVLLSKAIEWDYFTLLPTLDIINPLKIFPIGKEDPPLFFAVIFISLITSDGADICKYVHVVVKKKKQQPLDSLSFDWSEAVSLYC